MSVTKNVLQASTLKTSHLTSTSFIPKLSGVLKRHHGPRKETIGLAVSGGVDSMALAVLCSKVKEKAKTDDTLHQSILGNRLSKIDFKAFVVDHGVRQGSDIEANSVAKVLVERVDIPTQVLKIAWPGGETPTDMSNFESLARKYRYQTLGRACRDSGITSLLLAHHQDDQAETVLMRLVSGHRQLGLRGMKAESAIPECYGIHGIHESGGLESNNEKGSRSISKRNLDVAAPNGQLYAETGGIKIFRPLLDVSKEELIATCQSESMTWFEDHTNKDPTLTSRNAIRHLHKNYTLPAALTKPALLGLAQRCERRISDYQKATRHLLSMCNVRFDNRSGILSIRFVDIDSSTKKPRSTIERRFLATKVLQSYMMLVTPLAQIPTSTLSSVVKRIFPKLDLDWDAENSAPPVAFNIGSVQFQPHSEQSERQRTSIQQERWLLSRQVPSRVQIGNPDSNLQVTIPPCTNMNTPTWTPWTLYDGRFWIRIRNGTLTPLTLRLLTPSDMSQIQSQSHKNWEKLKILAPGRIRFTLPVLMLQDQVLALPTMGWRIDRRFNKVEWEVRYKKLYIEGMEGIEKTL